MTAEYPRRVAEFVAAVRAEAGRRRFNGVMDGLVAERTRRQDHEGSDAASRYLPDAVRLAMLVAQLGNVAGEFP